MVAGAAAIAGAIGSPGLVAPASAATSCSSLSDPLYQRATADTKRQLTNLLTLWKSEAEASVANGFTQDLGTPVKVSADTGAGLVPIRRLYNTARADFMWIQAGKPIPAGYQDQGTYFYASPDAGTGCAAFSQLTKNGYHRYALGTAREQLLAAGWTDQGAAFYANPTATSRTFSIAVMPDTQTEVTKYAGDRFLNRTTYLAANKSALGLRFVGHTGDVVNWGWLEPSQYAVASHAMKPLEQVGLPYSLAIGNHDTRSVDVGGVAYVNNPDCVQRFAAAECVSNKLVRHTEEFNAVFNASRFTAVGGAYEPGKVDNIYSTFTAAGKKWLVLSLEFVPRAGAVAWAKNVVASHPDYNVIVQTHYFLEANSTISTSNAGYGNTPASTVWNTALKPYPNVKMVFSGHIGEAGYRTETTSGGTVPMFLQNHPGGENPVRLVQIDADKGIVTSKIYVPRTGQTLSAYSTTTTGLNFVG